MCIAATKDIEYILYTVYIPIYTVYIGENGARLDNGCSRTL